MQSAFTISLIHFELGVEELEVEAFCKIWCSVKFPGFLSNVPGTSKPLVAKEESECNENILPDNHGNAHGMED